jgi:hypothetical protein
MAMKNPRRTLAAYAINKLLRGERRFDAFVRIGMDRIAIEKFQFFGRRVCPGFDEATVARVDAQGTFER